MTFHSRSDAIASQTPADVLVISFWRAWSADLAGEGGERWQSFWEAVNRTLPAEQGQALFGDLHRLTLALAAAASGPARKTCEARGSVNRRERLILTMLASVQRGRTYDALASAWALVAPDVSVDVFDAAQRLGLALSRQGLFLSQPCLHDGIGDPFVSPTFDRPSRSAISP